jgi:hypothetical protein
MCGRMMAWERGGTEFWASAEPANGSPSLRCDCLASDGALLVFLSRLRVNEAPGQRIVLKDTGRPGIS